MVRKNSAKLSPHRAKSTPCLQIPATNEITFLICAKDPISGFRAIPAIDRQDFHQPRFTIKITVKRTKIHKIPKSPHSVNNQSKVSKLNPSIRTHIPHTQNYFASCKTNNHPTTPILRPPPRPKYAHSTNG